jgi:phage terminase large subunit GpA-like protein
MDSLSPSSPVETVDFCKGAQVGGTEAGNNWIGYVIDQAPGPMLAVQPTVETAKRNSKQRIDPLIEESDVLREKVRDRRSRDAGNTILTKEFPGGVLVMTGANSGVGLRSMPARYVFLDEVDAYDEDVDGEGDPVSLAVARARTFPRRKIYRVSTPKIKGHSRIESGFEAGSGERYHVPCPHCGVLQSLKFGLLKWPAGLPLQAKYICEACDQPIPEYHKTAMLAAGEWVAERPELKNSHRSFHLSSLYSPVGWFSWGEAAEMFEAAHRDPSRLKAFVNTVLGETWQEKGEAPDDERLYLRAAMERYERGTVPAGGLFLTAGVDVQKTYLQVEIVAWGRGKESWSIDYRVIEGNPTQPAVWGKLDELLNETFPHVAGLQMPIAKLACDSGYATGDVYFWVRGTGDRAIAVDGRPGGSVPVAFPSLVDVTVRGRKISNGLKLWPVSTGLLKSELYGWLSLDAPTNEELNADPPAIFPPGYCHFPKYDAEFFKQLTAERLVARKNKQNYTKLEWQKTRERNEALDCRVYARAAAYVVGLDRFREANWVDMENQIVNETMRKSVPVTQAATTPGPVARPAARASEDSWFGDTSNWFGR